MSRDYKSRKTARSTPEKGGSAFLGGFVGYALGLASAIGIWVYFNYGPNPFLATEKTPSSAEINQKKSTAETPAKPEKAEKEEPIHLTEEKPKFDFYKILPGIDEPEIDHSYRPAMEPPPIEPPAIVKTPEVNTKLEKPAEPAPPIAPLRPAPVTSPPEPAPQVAAIQPRTYPAEPAPPRAVPPATSPPPAPEKFFLQAGSFRKNDEAENLKARLALLGLFATVQPIDLAERGMWYRVRVGPFNNRTDVDRANASLKENGIEAQFVKIQ